MRLCQDLKKKNDDPPTTTTTTTTRSKIMNRQKILESWERFTTSLRDVAEAEWSQRKGELFRYLRSMPGTIYIEDYPLKTVLISTIPAVLFMTFFQFFSFWQYVFHPSAEPFTHLPAVEYFLFGCLPHQIISRWTHPVLDVLAAFPYLAHFLLPFGYPAYCFYHRKKLGNTIEPAMRGLWLGGLTAFLAVLFQFLVPTSPPWWNESAVYDSEGNIISYAFNEAGFQRVDALIKHPLFREIYANAPVTHGSFPSLHAAFPFVIFLNGAWVCHGGWKFGLLHVLWISWAAMYSHHHYLVDILGGMALSLFLFTFYHRVWNPFSKPAAKYTPLPVEEAV